MCEDIFGCYNARKGVATRIWYVEVKDIVKYPTMHRTAPLMTKS